MAENPCKASSNLTKTIYHKMLLETSPAGQGSKKTSNQNTNTATAQNQPAAQWPNGNQHMTPELPYIKSQVGVIQEVGGCGIPETQQKEVREN